MKQRWFISAAIGLLGLAVGASLSCSRRQSSSRTSLPDRLSNTFSAGGLGKGNDSAMTALRFLENRVKGDPDDIVALNKLSAYYLQLYRETSDVQYLDLALRSARSSLRVLGVDQNLSGLVALAEAEYATHNFVAARDHGQQLIEYQRDNSIGYQVMGDALIELGDYEHGAAAYSKLEALDADSVTAETRVAHLAFLRGDSATALRRYANALNDARKALVPLPETIAWCHWQLGEMSFQVGDYEGGERHDRDALAAYPNYVRALGSLGRVRAARGDLTGAITQYEHAVRIIPDPLLVAALGDLYQLSGRTDDAARQYVLVEQIGRLNELNGVVYNRQLAVFLADHDREPEAAYANAAREYSVRRDIYGADALAWTALKAGKLAEAQTTINEALRLGTKDARIFYHAGMIARAAGDQTQAHDYLKRALALNPQFDPLQAPVAKRALAQ